MYLKQAWLLPMGFLLLGLETLAYSAEADAGLKELAGLRQLQTLWLGGTTVDINNAVRGSCIYRLRPRRPRRPLQRRGADLHA